MLRRLLALVFLAAICADAKANLANFNSLTAGTNYPSGSLFSNGGLDFDVLFGLSPLGVQTASSPINPSITGNYLRLPTSVALNVNLPTGASQIKFDFIQNDPAAAVSVNGPFVIFDQIPTTVNGVTLTHLLGTKDPPLWGRVTMTGAINTFVVVGTALSVDNMDATLSPGLAGDYNKNHFVDAADFVVWRKNIGTPSAYRSWRANFGASDGSGNGTTTATTGVPEPSAVATILICLSCLVTMHRRR